MGSATIPAKPEFALRCAAFVIRAAAVFMRCCNRSSSDQEAKPPGTGVLSTKDPVVAALPPGAAVAGVAVTPAASSVRPIAVTATRRSIATGRRAVGCGRIIGYLFPQVSWSGPCPHQDGGRGVGVAGRILDGAGHRWTPPDGERSAVELSYIGNRLSSGAELELLCPCVSGGPDDRGGGRMSDQWVPPALVRRQTGRPERSSWPARASRRRPCRSWPGCCANCAAVKPVSRARPC